MPRFYTISNDFDYEGKNYIAEWKYFKNTVVFLKFIDIF